MIPLHLKHLETFLWAARLGSFTAVAERMHATQSTISMRIAELEQRFGTPLFIRQNRRVQLTPKGEELMGYVERLLQLVNEIQERIAAPDTLSGILRIGVTEVVAQTWLPAFVRALHQRFPKVSAKFEVALTQEVMDRLAAGQVEVALAPGRRFQSGLAVRSLGLVEFTWVASPHLELPASPLGPRELQNQRIIVLPRESFHHVTLEEWFHSNKALYRPSDVCNSMGVVASLTIAGLGVSLLPPICYEREIASGQLAVVPTVPKHPPVEFFAITLADKFDALKQLVVDLASEVSTFKRPPAEHARRWTDRVDITRAAGGP